MWLSVFATSNYPGEPSESNKKQSQAEAVRTPINNASHAIPPKVLASANKEVTNEKEAQKEEKQKEEVTQSQSEEEEIEERYTGRRTWRYAIIERK
jgi:hypothetical protein